MDVQMQANDFMTPTCRKALHDGDGHPLGADAAQSRTSALDSGQGKYKYVIRCCHPDGDHSVAWVHALWLLHFVFLSFQRHVSRRPFHPGNVSAAS